MTSALKGSAPFLLLIALLTAGCSGAEDPAPHAASPAPAVAASPARAATTKASKPVFAPASDAERTALLDRVAMIGASATSGFGAVVRNDVGPSALTTLSKVFAAAVKRSPPPAVTNRGHLMFFNAPMDIGPRLVDGALRADPTLVIGVDFLFWYGYGSLDRNRRTITDELVRVDLLEEGLAQLDRITCPLVIGDFPDVSAAIGFMLSESQVPEADTLEILNARVYEWAAARPHVIVLPFADLVGAMRANESFTVGGHTWPADSERTLVQPDRLHPTTHGLVALVQMIVHELLDRFPLLRSTDFDLDPAIVIKRLLPPIGEATERRNGKGDR